MTEVIRDVQVDPAIAAGVQATSPDRDTSTSHESRLNQPDDLVPTEYGEAGRTGSTTTLATGDTPDPPIDSAKTALTSPTTNLWILPIPRSSLRHDPSRPFTLSLILNLLLAFSATASVQNLYYNQPILSYLSEAFGVTYGEISLAPTLCQAGYAVGILLISPLGDLVRRRSMILLLLACTATLSIGIAVSPNLRTFEVLSFFVSLLTVTPQIALPLTADLAKPEKRAQALSITLAGLTLGVLTARVLSGIITQVSTWRNVYWMAVGLQYGTCIVLYFYLPDFPPKAPNMNYFKLLWSILGYVVAFPTLVQCCLIGFLSSSVFSNFWNISTFLLSDTYHYNPLEIGLFGLIGILGILCAPFVGRFIDRMGPWVTNLIALGIQIVITAISLGAAERSIGVVAIVCFGLDVGLQMGQVSLGSRIFSLKPEARARLNSLFIISLFAGQMVGVSAGAHLYTRGGWKVSQAFSLALLGAAVVILVARGPHSQKWVGWDGGRKLIKEREGKGGVGDEEQGEEVVEERKDIDGKDGEDGNAMELTKTNTRHSAMGQ